MPVLASKKPVWITLISALLVHTVLISLQTSQRMDTGFVRVWLLDSLAPMEKLVDMTLGGTGNIWSRYIALIGVHDENAKLRGDVDQLRMELARSREDVLEAQRLRRLLEVKETATYGKTVVARVIGRAPSPTHQTLTIDKGLSHGVQGDSAVFTPDGIVGRVIYSANFYSVVQLIIDSQSAVGIMVQSSRQQGIIKGNGGQELDLDYIDDDTDLKEGDSLITSGMDRVYPKGLPVGTISMVGARRGLFKVATIRPTVNLGRLEEVICMTERPPQIVDPTDEDSPASSPENP
jgi:rod shape-determining protein MreC